MGLINSFAPISNKSLLGFSSPYGPQMTSLLGLDPAEMRRQALMNGVAQAGIALMTNPTWSAAGGAFLRGTNQGRDEYLQNAMLGYKLKTAADDRAYSRSRDAQSDAWRQKEWDYNTGRQNKADAWTNTERQHQLDQWQQADDLRQGQQNAVQGFMNNYAHQGGTLPFSPGVRGLARQNGIDGVSSTDKWRYDQMQPDVQAGNYPDAFTSMKAQPPAPKIEFGSPGSGIFQNGQLIGTVPKEQEPPKRVTVRRGNQEVTQEWNPQTGRYEDVASGDAFKTTPDVVNNISPNGEPPDTDLRKKLSENEASIWKDYKTTADTAGGMLQDLHALDALGQAAPTGPLSGRLAEMFPGFSSAGDAYQSIVSRVAPTLRQAGSGSTSDVEYEGFLKSLPRLRNTPEGNAVISGIMQRKAEINVQRGEIVDRYLNNEISAVEARKQLTALNRQSILDPQMKRLIDATGKGSVSDLSDEELLKQLQGGQ